MVPDNTGDASESLEDSCRPELNSAQGDFVNLQHDQSSIDTTISNITAEQQFSSASVSFSEDCVLNLNPSGD